VQALLEIRLQQSNSTLYNLVANTLGMIKRNLISELNKNHLKHEDKKTNERRKEKKKIEQ
jgi:hypothetical protein